MVQNLVNNNCYSETSPKALPEGKQERPPKKAKVEDRKQIQDFLFLIVNFCFVCQFASLRDSCFL